MKKLVLVMLLLLAFPGLSTNASVPLQHETVRVALLKGVDSVRIEGGGILALEETGTAVDAGLPLIVKRSRDGLSVNGRFVRLLRVSAPVSVQVNGKGYRGIIEVVPLEKGLQVVDELPLEDYLVGLINCEISSQWPIESIKAQAVIARSYALYQMEARKNAPYHLESSVLDQVYDGCDIEDSRAARGVRETEGETLSFDGRVIQAFYHSNCGGHTDAAENVWGYPIPFLQGVACRYCASAASTRWTYGVSYKKLEAVLKAAGIQVPGLREVKPGKKNRSGRLTDLQLVFSRGSLTVSAVNFRKAVGYTLVKSTNMDVKNQGDEALFSGWGYGHGVGLCQWGAKERAEEGFDYQEILAYYYPGTSLQKKMRDQ